MRHVVWLVGDVHFLGIDVVEAIGGKVRGEGMAHHSDKRGIG